MTKHILSLCAAVLLAACASTDAPAPKGPHHGAMMMHGGKHMPGKLRRLTLTIKPGNEAAGQTAEACMFADVGCVLDPRSANISAINVTASPRAAYTLRTGTDAIRNRNLRADAIAHGGVCSSLAIHGKGRASGSAEMTVMQHCPPMSSR